MRTLLPLLQDYDAELLQVPVNQFDYLNREEIRSSSLSILRLDTRRLLIYGMTCLLIISLIGAGLYLGGQDQPHTTNQPQDQSITVQLEINYAGVRSTDHYNLSISQNMTVLQILSSTATVNITSQYGEPFVVAINGVWQNDNLTGHYWVFYINGNYVNTGAASTFPQSNDQITWRYK